MSPPPPRQTQHLVFEAEREHYAASRACQERGVIKFGGAWSSRARDRGWSRYLDRSRDLRAANGIDERLRAHRKIRFADVEGRDEAHCLIVRAAGDDENVALERAGDGGLAVLRVVELDGDHRAVAADLADVRIVFERRQLADHLRAETLRPRDEVLVADHLERREA